MTVIQLIWNIAQLIAILVAIVIFLIFFEA